MKQLKYDILSIQKDIDENNMSWKDLKNKYKMVNSTLATYVKKGLIKSNPKNKNQWRNGYKCSEKTIELIREKAMGKKHTEETKKKISEIRIKYLTEHPDKVPYIINHSSKRSWPEMVFENALKSYNIVGWQHKYRNGMYEYDFAFPTIKLDVEIDGGTHKTEKVRKIDQRRDEFSIKDGWKVLRFEAEKVKKDVVSCINELQKYF